MSEFVQVAMRTWVVQAQIWATNSTVLVHDAAALLVDPAIVPAEISAIGAGCAARGWQVVAGVATHGHWDHVLWSPDLPEVTRWATPRAVLAAAEVRDRDLEEACREAPGTYQEGFGRLTALTVPHVAWGDSRATVHEHQGHAPGHLALVWAADGVLLVGDMLSDSEVPLLDLDSPTPLADYRAGLELLAELGGQVEVMIPGHGSVATGAEIGRRVERDWHYLEGLASGRAAADPRLGDEWVAGEHARQLARLRELDWA